MVSETNAPTQTAADTAEKQADAVASTVKAAAREGERTAEANAKTTRRAARKVRKTARKAVRQPVRSAAKARPARNERNDEMKFDNAKLFAGFAGFPAAPSFDKLFADAAGRGEDLAKRSRKAVEELADIYRGNVEALVEAGRIAASGAQSIGQDFANKSRDSFEQATSSVRSFAEAKNPTELLQLQGEFARGAFDRFVEDSSALTESVVKLAGEAFQPLSSRASANVERFNEIAA